MSEIVLIDTTVYLNILDVPGRNQNRESVKNSFDTMIAKKAAWFLLPIATILETGNHISRLSDGNQRREYAEKMVEDVCKALKGDLKGNPPYIATPMPESRKLIEWLNQFPDHAMRSKKDKNEGGSLSDFTIKKEWEKTCADPFNRNRRVWIWALDSDLSSCDRTPEKGK